MIERHPGNPPSPYEELYGFSRVLRTGSLVMVGGTTSIRPDGAIVGETPYDQAVEILGKIVQELDRFGAGPADVIQVRIYVTDISRSAEVGRAHGEVFAQHRPLMTMVGISALVDPRMLVEMEAVALLPA